jgi:hypothetical protein
MSNRNIKLHAIILENISKSYAMAFFISFVLPCGSFIVIENAVPTTADTAGVGDRRCGRVRLAWTMLLLSIVGAAVCTINSIRGFG